MFHVEQWASDSPDTWSRECSTWNNGASRGWASSRPSADCSTWNNGARHTPAEDLTGLNHLEHNDLSKCSTWNIGGLHCEGTLVGGARRKMFHVEQWPDNRVPENVPRGTLAPPAGGERHSSADCSTWNNAVLHERALKLNRSGSNDLSKCSTRNIGALRRGQKPARRVPGRKCSTWNNGRHVPGGNVPRGTMAPQRLGEQRPWADCSTWNNGGAVRARWSLTAVEAMTCRNAPHGALARCAAGRSPRGGGQDGNVPRGTMVGHVPGENVPRGTMAPHAAGSASTWGRIVPRGTMAPRLAGHRPSADCSTWNNGLRCAPPED